MATMAAVVGDGPILFFNEGAHIEVPLSALFFNGDQIDTSRADLRALPEFVSWIKFLSQQKRIVAAAAPPVMKAIELTAVEPGAAGNRIDVTVTPGVGATVDIAAIEIDTYVDLTMATLRERLGEDGLGVLGTQYGLAHVKTFPAGSDTATVSAMVPTAATAGASPKWTIAGTSVTLVPRRATGFADGDVKTIAITDVSAAGDKFTLTVTWKKTVAGVGNETGLVAALASLGYLIKGVVPGTGFRLPRPGTVKLTGGLGPLPPTPAGATVLAAP